MDTEVVVPDLEVDLVGLESFAGNLDGIRARLAAAHRELRADAFELGDADVVDGLEHFGAYWRDGRKKIEGDAKTLATMAHSSVAQYRRTDSDLARGLTVHGGPGTSPRGPR